MGQAGVITDDHWPALDAGDSVGNADHRAGGVQVKEDGWRPSLKKQCAREPVCVCSVASEYVTSCYIVLQAHRSARQASSCASSAPAIHCAHCTRTDGAAPIRVRATAPVARDPIPFPARHTYRLHSAPTFGPVSHLVRLLHSPYIRNGGCALLMLRSAARCVTLVQAMRADDATHRTPARNAGTARRSCC